MDNLAADTLSADNYYSDDVSTLGERISVAREHAGLTLNDLAKALAVQSDTLRGWEVDTAEPRANKLSMMAGVLGVTPSWLMNGIGEGAPAPLEDDTDLDERALRRKLLGELRETQRQSQLLHRRLERIVDALAAFD